MPITSSKTLLFVSLVLMAAFIFYQPWEKGIIGGADSWGYYAYLPATFIHHDLQDMEKSEEARKSYFPLGRSSLPKLENGNYLNQYTCGVALLNLPAFGVAHLMAKSTAYPADGYSLPYNFMIVWSGLLYVIGGLFFLRKFLLNFFEDRSVALTILAVGLATNLYFVGILQGAMAHGYLFFLVSLLLFLTQRWHEKGNPKSVIWIALVAGMISLIRPNVSIVLLIPFFFTPRSFAFFYKKPLYLFWGIGCYILPAIPQMLYWKKITGAFISYSYGEQGFDFLHPHLMDGLFSFQNGWLIYTPIMALSIIGVFIGIFKKDRVAIVSSVLVASHIYVIYSWWCWNYINGFGSRAMVDIYPVLAYPLTLVFVLLQKNKMLLNTAVALVIFFAGLNIFQTHQNYTKVLWSEGGTSAYYYSVFGKTKLDHDALVALDCNIIQPQRLSLKKLIAKEDFESGKISNADTTLFFAGEKSYVIRPKEEYTPSIKTTIGENDLDDSNWLRASAQCLSKGYGSFHYNSHLVVSIGRQGETLLWKSIRINNKIRDTYYSVHNGEIDKWKEVGFYIPLKGLDLLPTDEISIYGWNTTNIPVHVDDLKLEIWGK